MEESERENWEEKLILISIARNPQQVLEEIDDLKRLAKMAEEVEAAAVEAKLTKLRELMQEQGFFEQTDQRLLIFTEYKDTLDYLVERLRSWGFQAGFIHGGMKPRSRDEAGTRLWAEEQFKERKFPNLVATETARERINLHLSNLLLNDHIPSH